MSPPSLGNKGYEAEDESETAVDRKAPCFEGSDTPRDYSERQARVPDRQQRQHPTRGLWDDI